MKVFEKNLEALVKEAYVVYFGKKVDKNPIVQSKAILIGEHDNPKKGTDCQPGEEDCYFGYLNTTSAKKDPSVVLLRFPKNGTVSLLPGQSAEVDQELPRKKIA